MKNPPTNPEAPASTNWRLTAIDEGGNLDVDPKFVAGPTGTWSQAAVYNAALDQTFYTTADAEPALTENALNGKFLTPAWDSQSAFYIVSNSTTWIAAYGNGADLGTAGAVFRVYDAHLQSTNGHWSHGGDWVADPVDSPCLDKGDPAQPLGPEPTPNGGRVNLGAYGATAQASKSADVQNPEPVARFAVSAGTNQAVLSWYNPMSADFQGVLVLRKTGSAPAGSPSDRSAYSVSDTIGDGTVVYIGAGASAVPGAASSWTDTTAANGTHYYYAIFAMDTAALYSAARTGDTTPAEGTGNSPIYVNAAATGAHNGTSWTDAYTNLHAALRAAGSGTAVWVAEGRYWPGDTRRDSFELRAGVQVYGGFTNGSPGLADRDTFAHATVLSGDHGIPNDVRDNAYHVVQTAGANSLLDGFQVVDGNANSGYSPDFRGAAVYVTQTGTRILNCFISRNQDTGSLNDGSGAICGTVNYLTISNCVFTGNAGVSGVNFHNGTGHLLKNCVFWANGYQYGLFCPNAAGDDISVVNGTFVGNAGTQVRRYTSGIITVKNSIFKNNTQAIVANGTIYVSYSDVEGCGGSDAWALDAAKIKDNGGNIDTDPLFVGGPTGAWTADAVYDSATDQTTLTDAGAAWTLNALRGRFLNPDTAGKAGFYVTSNSANQIVVAGNAAALGVSEKNYAVHDLHLQSEVGHWTFGNVWVDDDQTSPCVDAGDPADPFASEPEPNGGRINMGAYGNTPQASQKQALPPDPVLRLFALAENGQVRLIWENSLSGTFTGVLILRKAGGPPSATPAKGTAYSAPDTLGDAEIVYVGPGSNATPGAASGWTDLSAVNDTHYHYAVFAADGTDQYSTGANADTTPATTAGESPLYVDDSAAGANNGTSWSDAYTSLSAALAQATNGMAIWVAEGLYTPGTRRTDTFTPATNVTVYGGFTSGMTDPSQRDWLEHPTRLSGEIEGDNLYHVIRATAPCVIDGVHVRDGYANGSPPDNDGGGIYVSAADVILRHCVLTHSHADNFGSALYVSGTRITVSDCIFAGHTGNAVAYLSGEPALFVRNQFLFNATPNTIYAASGRVGIQFLHSTFAGNQGYQLYQHHSGYSTATNCILWGNTNTVMTGFHLSHCNIEGSGGSGVWTLPIGRDLADEGGNIDTNPLFGVSLSGTWTQDPAYDAGTDRTTLTDANAAFPANRLRGAWINLAPGAGGGVALVVANSATQVSVLGNATALATNGTAYEALDVHLQSKQGRWSRNGWISDPAQSPCIDAADPASAWDAELAPNGGRANMGAYGNTAQASLTFIPPTGTLLLIR